MDWLKSLLDIFFGLFKKELALPPTEGESRDILNEPVLPELDDEPTEPNLSVPNVTEISPIQIDKPIEQHYTKSDGKTGSRWYSGWTRQPWVIVVHYSAGMDAQGCMDALTNRGLSVHCTIERDGKIWRHVDDDDRAIHAGYGRWGGVSGMNSHALGFEIVNLGWMEGVFDPNATSPHNVWKGDVVDSMSDGTSYFRDESYTKDGKKHTTRVVTDSACAQFPDHREEWKTHYWSEYPDPQLGAVFWQIWQWVKKFDIMLENIVGHEHVTPHKKQDPGPQFPWKKLEVYLEEKAKVEKPELLDPEHNQKLRIKAVQSHCSRMGLAVGDVDGWWGDKTKDAVEEVVERWGDLYGFKNLEVREDNCLVIANALRLVPGFDPDRA
jgi:N-acetyl-anhydromuramyl-L-alanine amidase AmpD